MSFFFLRTILAFANCVCVFFVHITESPLSIHFNSPILSRHVYNCVYTTISTYRCCMCQKTVSQTKKVEDSDRKEVFNTIRFQMTKDGGRRDGLLNCINYSCSFWSGCVQRIHFLFLSGLPIIDFQPETITETLRLTSSPPIGVAFPTSISLITTCI